MRLCFLVKRLVPQRIGPGAFLIAAFLMAISPLMFSATGCGGGGSSSSGTPTPTPTPTPTQGAGGRIVFSSTKDTGGIGQQVYTIFGDGSSLTRLATNLADEAPYSWSPDGARLLFSSNRDNGNGLSNNRDIYVMNADGSGPARLTKDTTKNSVYSAWSPDGKKIAFSQARQIAVMNADGSAITDLTSSGDTIAGAINPIWSPDGGKIAFVADTTHETLGTNAPQSIYVMNADGTSRAALTTGGEYIHQVAWSPDGQSLVFDSSIDTGGAASLRTQIYRMNADGTNRVRLTNNAAADVSPSWSPDGTQILFSSNRDHGGGSGGVNAYDLYRMNPDGSSVVRITTTGLNGFVAPGGWKK